MSADGRALAAPAPATILTDQRTRRILRFAVGTTVGSGFAYLIGFELPFLVPILIAMLLASPAPRPTFESAAGFVIPVAAGAFVGVLLTRYVLPYQGIFLLIEFVVLYRIFYSLAGGARPLRMVWLLIAALIIPLMGMASIGLAIGVAVGLVYGAAIAVGVAWFAHVVLPDLPSGVMGQGKPGQAAKEPPPPAARAAYARRTVTVVFPVLMVFFFLNLSSDAVILVFIGLLSLLPSFAAGWKQGKALIVGNLIGGAGAIVFYNLLVVYPQIGMFLLLTLLTGLLFGDFIFSDRPAAPLFKTAFNSVVLLVGMSVTITGADAASKFYTRIAQIILAVVYVAVAFGFLEYLQRKRVKKA
ncbi:MAG: DUF2955 domain-containing protein [marine benthic group bacterium]|jgi:hypothetical protein|nr:DUF2955 domain-containing protein [Candidatus Benthicola marisminoris]